MFTNLKNNKVYKFSIELDNIMRPYWDLMYTAKGFQFIKDIKSPSTEIENEVKDIIQDFEKREKEGDSDTFDPLNNYVYKLFSKYFKNKVFNIAEIKDCLGKFVYVGLFSENFLFLMDGGVMKTNDLSFSSKFKRLLRKTKSVQDFLKSLTLNEEIATSFNPAQYDILLEDDDQIESNYSLESPIYEESIIDFSNLWKKEVKEDAIWINYNLFNTISGVNLEMEDKISILFADKDTDVITNAIGLLVDKYFIPLSVDWKNYVKIKKEIQYLWINIKNSIYNDFSESKNNKIPKKTPLQEDFLKTAIEDKKFSNLLSFLEDNLYLPSKYEGNLSLYDKFFDKLVLHKDLDKLKNYRIISPDNEEGNGLLNIYKINKEYDEKSNNLLHSVESKGNKNKRWRSAFDSSQLDKEYVKVLKSELSFYYVYRYFEDYFCKALEEIGVQYIANQHVLINSKKSEIDIIAFNGKEIFFIELKTNLGIDHIRAYEEKVRHWSEAFDTIKNKISFIIIGANSKKELSIFNARPKGRYNNVKPQEGSATIPYNFSIQVQIPFHNNYKKQKITCITESSFIDLCEVLKIIFK